MKVLRRLALPLCVGLLAVLDAPAGVARTYVVCPAGSAFGGCDYVGNNGIQQAVDQAADGDRILLRSGRYAPRAYRDVTFGDLTIRGYVLVAGKALTLSGEPGVVLDGRRGERASAVVVHRGSLTLDGMSIEGFRVASADDDIYDGHGVFVIDGSAVISEVTFRSIEKMALSIRGDSRVQMQDSRVLDGHVGIWIEEDATLHLQRCLIRNNDSAGIAAYVSAVVEIDGCVFERNLDDAIYGEANASVRARNSLFIRNEPYAVRAVDNASIDVSDSFFYANAAAGNSSGGDGGPSIRSANPFRGHCSDHDERHSEFPDADCSQ